MNKKRESISAYWKLGIIIGIGLIVFGILFYLAAIGHQKLLVFALVGIACIGLVWGFVAGGFLGALGVLVAVWLLMKVIDYVLKPVAFILILGGVICTIVSFVKGMRNKGSSKGNAYSKEDIANRPLDGTYEIVMIYYSPENRWITPKEFKMEGDKLILYGNRYELHLSSASWDETGTFTVEKNNKEKIIFYVDGIDGEEIFEGVVKRGRNYAEIDKFTIVDKSDRLSEYEFRFQQKYGN